jgi:hypothetical protein
MTNSWMTHVKSVSKANKGIGLKEILKMAKKTYKKSPGVHKKTHKKRKTKHRKKRKTKHRKKRKTKHRKKRKTKHRGKTRKKSRKRR